MRKLYISPYKMGSESAKKIAEMTGAKRLREPTIRMYNNSILINWGKSSMDSIISYLCTDKNVRVLNAPASTKIAANKLSCLQRLVSCGIPTVDFTYDQYIARGWLDQGNKVYCRTKLNANSGDGIVICQPGDELRHAPLYTLGLQPAHEYRVHVFRGGVLDVSKKRRRNGENTNDLIKNLQFGWVFCREDINETPRVITETALNAIHALRLDFGAVDILYKRELPYVLEVNTAPGLEGSTLDKYVQAFNKMRYK